MKKEKISRSQLRKHALALVFALDFTINTNNDNIETETENQLDDYIFHQDLEFSKTERQFILNGYSGTKDNLKKIDQALSSSLKDWDIKRLNKVDLAILRLATYEIVFGDTPKKVAINEAIELAKEFSSDEAPSFVNGMLAKIVNIAN